MTIQVSTKVCSFGKQVVEKVETEYARYQDGRYVYKLDRSPMCEYMINFILKLKNLPEKYMMNSVLENFTILQVINPKRSGNNGVEIALCKPVIETRLDDCRAGPIVRENGTQDKSAHWLDLRSRPPLKTWFVHTTTSSSSSFPWTQLRCNFVLIMHICPASLDLLTFPVFRNDSLRSLPCCNLDFVLHLFFIRWSHTARPERRCYASPTSSRCPHPSTEPSTTSTDLSRTEPLLWRILCLLAGFRREYKEVLLCSR